MRHLSRPQRHQNTTEHLSWQIVDIARSDWPHFFPDFYINILELIHSRDTMALGLNMLLIASEELATPREDLPAQRREELAKLLGVQVPQVRERERRSGRSIVNVVVNVPSLGD